MRTYFKETNLSGKVLYALNEWRKQREQRDRGGESGKREASCSETKPGRKVQSKKTGTATRPEPDWDKEILSYCEKAESLHEILPVAGFATHIKVPIDIEDIYVPLRAMIDLRFFAEGGYYSSDHAEKCLRGCDEALDRLLQN